MYSQEKQPAILGRFIIETMLKTPPPVEGVDVGVTERFPASIKAERLLVRVSNDSYEAISEISGSFVCTRVK